MVLVLLLLIRYYFPYWGTKTYNNQEIIELCISNFLKAPFFYFVIKANLKKERSFACFVTMTLIMQIIFSPIASFDWKTEFIKLAALLMGITAVWVFALLNQHKRKLSKTTRLAQMEAQTTNKPSTPLVFP